MAGLLGEPRTIPTGRGRVGVTAASGLAVAAASLRGRPRPEYTMELAPMLTFRRRPAMVRLSCFFACNLPFLSYINVFYSLEILDVKSVKQ